MLEILAKFDCHTGTSFRYIIGRAGGHISGAIYISDGVAEPDSILLTIKKRGEADEERTFVPSESTKP